MNCFFVSDLHGRIDRYEKLFNLIIAEKPEIVFFGGDLLPSFNLFDDFITEFFVKNLLLVKDNLKETYPEIFVILGNDDLKSEEEKLISAQDKNLFHYINLRKISFENINVYGYSCVPPSPFLLKDWEKYDVSRYVDPGCVSPEEGFRSVKIEESEIKFSTIKNDLDRLINNEDVRESVFLFHSPPYKTNLDRLDNDGKFIDYVPLDNFAGSIAIRKFIENHQPMLTLHGHIHESARKTGNWRDKIGRTHCFSAAHDGPELALVKFDTNNLDLAERFLI
jgi:Icc-related predicted phosphoesterase